MLSQRVAEAFDAWFARLAAARGVRLVVVGRADVLRLTVSKRHARGRVRRLDGSVRVGARTAARAGERIPARDAPDRPTPPRPLARRAAPRRAAPQLSCARCPTFARAGDASRPFARSTAARPRAASRRCSWPTRTSSAPARPRSSGDSRTSCASATAPSTPGSGLRAAPRRRGAFFSSFLTAGACAGAIARTPGTPRPTWPTGPPSPTRSAARRSRRSSVRLTTRSPPARSSRRGRRRPARRRHRRRPPPPQVSCFSSRPVFLLGLRGVGYIPGKSKKKNNTLGGGRTHDLGFIRPTL